MQKIYMISDLASTTGMSRYTLNFYLNIGLITESGRTGGNYRLFDETVIDRLNCINRLREDGHTLNQIREILEDDES